MHRVSPLQLADFSDDRPEMPEPRQALAGGSDRPPPDDEAPTGADVIPFPKGPRPPDGLRPWPDETGQMPAVDTRDEPQADALAGDDEPLWPHWMAHVLTRFRAPDGSSGGAGVFI